MFELFKLKNPYPSIDPCSITKCRKKKLDEKYELWMKNVFIDENAKKSKQNCKNFN
jgi:hypothetical protein